MVESNGSAARHCPRCQGKLREGDKFCPACGAALDSAAQLPEHHPHPAPASELETPELGTPELETPAELSARVELYWSEFKLIGYLYGALLLASLIIGWVGSRDTTPWTDVGAGIAGVVIVLGFAVLRHRDVVPLLGMPQGGWRGAIKLVALSLAAVALLEIYFYLLEKSGVEIIRMTDSYQEAGWSLGVMLLFISLIPAVTEELAFRGIVQTTLERIVGGREALLIQAAMFSVLHLLPMMFPSHFVLGLIFGYLRQRTRSIYPGMALHAAWNALVVLQEVYIGA
jgi:membrane protease YdiL (CAAX protease family)